MLLRIAIPAEVRLALLLIQILNYMWIDAIFVNHKDAGEDCLFELVCMESSWILQRCATVVFGSLLHIPARRIIPRMFRHALHLISNTEHSAERRGMFAPSLYYLFNSAVNRTRVVPITRSLLREMPTTGKLFVEMPKPKRAHTAHARSDVTAPNASPSTR